MDIVETPLAIKGQESPPRKRLKVDLWEDDEEDIPYTFLEGLNAFTERKENIPGPHGCDVAEVCLDKRLFDWSNYQKKAYKKLKNRIYADKWPTVEIMSDFQYKKLIEAGFPFNKNVFNWEVNFAKLKKHVEDFGDTKKGIDTSSALYVWIRNQRVQAAKSPLQGQITNLHYRRLEDIGVEFKTGFMATMVRPHYQKFGNLNVLNNHPLHKRFSSYRQYYFRHFDETPFKWTMAYIIPEMDEMGFDWNYRCVFGLENFITPLCAKYQNFDLTQHDRTPEDVVAEEADNADADEDDKNYDIDVDDDEPERSTTTKKQIPFHSKNNPFGLIGNPIREICQHIGLNYYNEILRKNLLTMLQEQKLPEGFTINCELDNEDDDLTIDAITYQTVQDYYGRAIKCAPIYRKLYCQLGISVPTTSDPNYKKFLLLCHVSQHDFRSHVDPFYFLSQKLRNLQRLRIDYWMRNSGLIKDMPTAKFLGLDDLNKKDLEDLAKLHGHDPDGIDPEKDYDKDHCFAVSSHLELLSVEHGVDPRKSVHLVFSIWNLLVLFWAKNSAKGNKCIYHCYVDVETKKWYFYVPDANDFLDVLEIYRRYGKDALSIGGVLFEDWNSDCPISMCVALSKKQAWKNLELRKQHIKDMTVDWIYSYFKFIESKGKVYRDRRVLDDYGDDQINDKVDVANYVESEDEEETDEDMGDNIDIL